MSRRRIRKIAIVCIVLAGLLPSYQAVWAASPVPTPGGTASGTTGGFVGRYVDGRPDAVDRSKSGQGSPGGRQTLNCGPPVGTGNVRTGGSDLCAQVRNSCVGSLTTAPDGRLYTTTGAFTRQPNGTWHLDTVNCTVTSGGPAVTGEMVRQEAVRLVPRSVLRMAGPRTLVNIDTVFWLSGTPAVAVLPVAILVGHRVRITARLAGVSWDFGDGATDTSTGPGRPYPVGDPCQRARCPGFFSHVYRHTGRLRVSARATWTGTYTVDGGPPQLITGTVGGPLTSAALHVQQSTVVLVPDPTGN